jgi:hypothetical protein
MISITAQYLLRCTEKNCEFEEKAFDDLQEAIEAAEAHLSVFDDEYKHMYHKLAISTVQIVTTNFR